MTIMLPFYDLFWFVMKIPQLYRTGENPFRKDQSYRQISWKIFRIHRFRIRENMWWTRYRSWFAIRLTIYSKILLGTDGRFQKVSSWHKKTFQSSNCGPVALERIFLHYGDNHVISPGRRTTNLVSNFEYLLLLCFLTMAEFWNLGHFQGIIRVP